MGRREKLFCDVINDINLLTFSSAHPPLLGGIEFSNSSNSTPKK
jgi:hypothetical protein